jgi:alkylhydroperoxidase family enzyme
MVRLKLPPGSETFEYVIGASGLAPAITKAAYAFSLTAYSNTALSQREFEGARMRVAQINGCRVCQSWRSTRETRDFFLKAGLSTRGTVVERGEAPDEQFYEDVREWRTSTLFSARERVAIEYAERFAHDHESLQFDETFWSKMSAQFSDAEIVDLTLCIGAWITMGRFAHVLGLDAVCPLPVPVQAGQPVVPAQPLSA